MSQGLPRIVAYHARIPVGGKVIMADLSDFFDNDEFLRLAIETLGVSSPSEVVVALEGGRGRELIKMGCLRCSVEGGVSREEIGGEPKIGVNSGGGE